MYFIQNFIDKIFYYDYNYNVLNMGTSLYLYLVDAK